MRQNRSKIIKNIVFGFGGQLLILAIGILVPRLIILTYGSEVNGLTSAITQVFSYLALLEAGIGNASINLLYKNISKKNRCEINETVSATRNYYNNVLPIYIICVLAFAIIYPQIVMTEVEKNTIRLIIFVQGMSGVIDFKFSSTYTQLLVADGRNYVVTNLNVMVKFCAVIIQIILISYQCDIVCVQSAFLLLYIVKAYVLNKYIKKQYGWIKVNKKVSTKLLEQRTSFVIHEISAVIFSNTDIFVLSIFCSMKIASVYAIYNLIFSSLAAFIGVTNRGIDFTLGYEYNKDKTSYVKLHDTYERFYMCISFSVITTACILVTPFIILYTKGVSDINYIDKYIPLLFSIIHLLSCCRAVSAKLITIADHAKMTIPRAILEDVVNVFFSIILVVKVGIYGVLLGTIIALLYRTNDIIFYANRKILRRNPCSAYKNMLLDFLLFCAFIIIFSKIHLNICNYITFIMNGTWIFATVLIVYFTANCLLNRSFLEFLLKRSE